LKGHGFSRAAKSIKQQRALAPAAFFSIIYIPAAAKQAAEKLNCLMAITAICLGFAYQ